MLLISWYSLQIFKMYHNYVHEQNGHTIIWKSIATSEVFSVTHQLPGISGMHCFDGKDGCHNTIPTLPSSENNKVLHNAHIKVETHVLLDSLGGGSEDMVYVDIDCDPTCDISISHVQHCFVSGTAGTDCDVQFALFSSMCTSFFSCKKYFSSTTHI